MNLLSSTHATAARIERATLTTTPHPHDPQADALTFSQASDLLRYFQPAGCNYQLNAMAGYMGIFDRTQMIFCGPESAGWEFILQRACFYPDATMCPPPPRFANIGTGVMQGSEFIATASSHNMAKRIANALNWYKPGKRGA